MHELALNPDIQHKVFDEILAVKEKLNGQPLNYESVLKLKYLGMVINEAHRKWAPSSFLERSCCKSYVIENTDGTKVELKPGDGIYTSVTGLQSDEKYFPDADRFDPERFNDVNKDSIRMGSYMPFSLGPSKSFLQRLISIQKMLLRMKYLPCSKQKEDDAFVSKCWR